MSNITPREQEVRSLIKARMPQLKLFAPDKTTQNKYASAIVQIATNKNLLGVSADSVVKTAFEIVQLGLNPNPLFGQAYVVPYKLKNSGLTAQLQIGYKGYITLLNRAGWAIRAVPVYDVDDFHIRFGGLSDEIEFEPNYDERENDNGQWVYNHLRGVIVYAKHKDGQEYSEFIPFRTLEKLRVKSQNQKEGQLSNIWLEWTEEMYLSKAIKRVAKKLPLDDERVIEATVLEDEPIRLQDNIKPEPKNKDINAAIIGKKPEPETSASPEPQPEQPQEEAPKQKRVPRYISKYYPTLEALGLKKHDARKFVDYMDWMEQPQEMIDGFFSQDESEIKRYINAFYGIGEPEEPDYTEAEVEEPVPETAPDDVMPEPEPQEDKAPAAIAGGFDISNAVVAQYPQFIKLGLKGRDCFPFAKWAGLNGDNIDEFMADLGGVQALIEQYYAEAGYAE